MHSLSESLQTADHNSKFSNPSSFSPILKSICLVCVFFLYSMNTGLLCDTLSKTLKKPLFFLLPLPQAVTDVLIFASYNPIHSAHIVCTVIFKLLGTQKFKNICNLYSDEHINVTKQLILALQVPVKEQSRTIPKAPKCLKLIQMGF